MNFSQKENRFYLQSSILQDNPALIHAFTCRKGGVSHGQITGLNLGFRVKDNRASVMENYHLVASDLGIAPEQMVLARQAHTDLLRLVTKKDAGKGLTRESDIVDTDGLLTAEKGVALVVFTADCVPVLLFDPRNRAIASIHAGWRGTSKGIVGKAVLQMTKQFGTRPSELIAAIGPSIGPCCFAFGEDAVEYFPESCCAPKKEGGFLVNLWQLNQMQLTEHGVLPSHIDLTGICTVCHADSFYSYRTHKDATGRQAAIIMLK